MSEHERQWIEWGVRRTWGAIGTIAYFERDRRTAEKCAKEWPGELVSRTVLATEWTEPNPTKPETATPESESADE